MIELPEIHDDDIARIEQLLTTSRGNEVKFNTEQIRVIKARKSCIIQACPGSGKTTTLVAKIGILSQQSLATTQGLCTLSHTNVAKQEIEKGLGPLADRVSRYPNFIGTIQAFVDRFVANQALIYYYGHRPLVIDDERFSVCTGAYTRRAQSLLVYLRRDQRFKDESARDILGRLRFCKDDIESVCLFVDGKEEELPAKHTDSYKQAELVKKDLAKNGIIAYEDAYALALNFIKTFPDICKVIQKRFPVVFLDEMQDTGDSQWRLIRTLFGGDTIVQQFGDTNQAIYNSMGQGQATSTGPESGVETIPINSSHRFSKSIATITSNLTAYPQVIAGNDSRPDLPHTVILFSQTTRQQVLHRFSELIGQHRLHENNLGIFKAVGLVGKPADTDTKLHIGSYFSQFNREKQKKAKNTFPSFTTCLDYARGLGSSESPSPLGLIRKLFLGGVVQCLHTENILSTDGRRHDEDSVAREIRAFAKENHGKLARRMTEMWINLAKGQEISNTAAVELFDETFSLFKKPPHTAETRTYIESPSVWIIPTPQGGVPQVATARFVGDNGIPITLDTIHAVKGETHDATLVLDTHWHKQHLAQLIEYLCGARPSKAPALRMTQKLKYAFVAMTRPRHLLCLAMDVSSVSPENQTRLRKAGWSVDIL